MKGGHTVVAAASDKGSARRGRVSSVCSSRCPANVVLPCYSRGVRSPGGGGQTGPGSKETVTARSILTECGLEQTVVDTYAGRLFGRAKAQ